MNYVKKVNNINTTGTSDLILKKLIITQKLMQLDRKLLIMIMLNILLLKNLNKKVTSNKTEM